MLTKKYTHLFFDLDNTLWDFDANSFAALRAALEKLGLLAIINSYNDFYEVYSEENDRLWDLYRKGLVPKKILRGERFEAAFKRNGTPLTIGGEVVNDAYLLEMVSQTRLIEGAHKVLQYLHSRYKIAIITNGFKEVQYDKIDKSELSKYFSKVFVSEEIGTPKPGKKIFEHAIKSMNAPKKSSLMIGDSWEADILGAMNFGIDQIFFSQKTASDYTGGGFQYAFDDSKRVLSDTYPSILAPNPEIKHPKKTKTSFISNLEQLLIIL